MIESQKINCWEFNNCDRVLNCNKCPANSEKRLDGIHGGKNAGRACWVVTGTLCKGGISGTFAQKYKDCHECEFYKIVAKEEGSRFMFSATLGNLLKNG